MCQNGGQNNSLWQCGAIFTFSTTACCLLMAGNDKSLPHHSQGSEKVPKNMLNRHLSPKPAVVKRLYIYI